jgi:rubrerythrin
MVEKSGIQKALEEAIRFEVDGREFFLQAAEKAETYFTKSIFKVLAEEELSHIQRVKEVHRRCLSSEKDVFLPPGSHKNHLENIFEQAKRETDPRVLMKTGEMEAVRLALQLEIKGHDFYDRLAREATGESEKAFYSQLAQEESVHFSVLRQMEEALLNARSFG